jgi:hypothetical protein
VLPLAVVGIGDRGIPFSRNSCTVLSRVSKVAKKHVHGDSVVVDRNWALSRHRRVDNVLWVMVVIGALNFGYFLGCAKMFKYQHVEDHDDGIDGPSGLAH